MIVEFGHFALALAFAVALAASILPHVGYRKHMPALMLTAGPAAIIQFLLVAIAYGALTWAYATSDFSVLNVFQNSHTDQPMIYRLSGVWGNHEGSILLWQLILSLFGACVAVFGRNIPTILRSITLAVQSLICLAFTGFILFTSNPFIRLVPSPDEGRSLNPILQDPGLAVHPPMLYIGYVGFSIVFSFAAAALLMGRMDAAWARIVRPWVLISWVALTAGIALGSYWAYYELGWGGFWFWDPVENASLMPWLVGTALMHSAIVMERRDGLKIWTVLLAVLAFSLSLLGTFLVRSGVLTSVHSFASDPARGLVILLILCVFIGGALTLFIWRAPQLAGGAIFAPISREGSLVLNNLFLSAACVAVFVGTLYPLVVEALSEDKISVGAPFFNATFLPLCLPLALAMPFGQQLAWKRGDIAAIASRLWVAIFAGLICAIVVYAATKGGPVLAALGLGLGAFVIVGSFDDLLARAMRGGKAHFWSRLLGLPRTIFAASLAHAGVGVFILGIAASAFHEEQIASLAPGDRLSLGGYELSFTGLKKITGPNYVATSGSFDLFEKGQQVDQLAPGKRSYVGRTMPTSETARYTTGVSQVYLAIGDTNNGKTDVRAYWKPLVLLIWIGPLIMSFAGLISMSDRRLRIGAPKMRASSISAEVA